MALNKGLTGLDYSTVFRFQAWEGPPQISSLIGESDCMSTKTTLRIAAAIFVARVAWSLWADEFDPPPEDYEEQDDLHAAREYVRGLLIGVLDS
jgi:hypothetical protein